MKTAPFETVAEYLATLPPERKQALSAVRRVINKHLPNGYREVVQYGMITYAVPLKLYPQGYLGKKDVPLPYISLASQKQHMAVYLMCVYGDAETARWFTSAWKKSGKKLNMGASCLRFKAVDDLALDVLAQVVARVPLTQYIERYERSRKPKAPKK